MTFGRNSMTSPMREHWERTERWFERFCDLVERRAHGERIDEEDVEDCALVVLQNCHAAEDWLQNQTKENALKKGMRKVFACPHMELCKSVVTASKHFTLTRTGQRRDGAMHPHENIRFFAWLHVPNRPGRVVTAPVLALMVEATYYQLDNFVLKCVESIRDLLI